MTTKARTNADNASADIQGVTAGSGITGGGTSGTVSVAVDSTVLRTTGGQVISANTSVNALEIRQIGAGNALVVEDSTNPDSSPTVIDATGNLVKGNTTWTNIGLLTAGMQTSNNSGTEYGGLGLIGWRNNTALPAALHFAKSDSSVVGTQTAVSAGTDLGRIGFYGSDGTEFIASSLILGEAEGTISTGVVPGRLIFSTANTSGTLTERMRIDASGNTTINAIADATTTTAARGAGYMGIPQSAASGSGAYTIVAADAGEHIYTTTTRTVTIPANSSVAFPVGTVLTFISGVGATTTIAITTDTMYLAGPGTTGSRTLAPHGMATAVKVASTTWYISGNGLT